MYCSKSKITFIQSAISERSGAVVEPYLSTQWFVKMQPLADEAVELQKGTRGKSKFRSGSFRKDVLALDGKYSRLVYFPSALVGTPHSSLVP